MPFTESALSTSSTSRGEACGLACRYSADRPATCGAAMDVPLMVLVAAVLPIQAEVMFWPGAKTSTQAPKFENAARTSRPAVIVVAATVVAVGVEAGDAAHAFRFSLPAATAYVTPCAMD